MNKIGQNNDYINSGLIFYTEDNEIQYELNSKISGELQKQKEKKERHQQKLKKNQKYEKSMKAMQVQDFTNSAQIYTENQQKNDMIAQQQLDNNILISNQTQNSPINKEQYSLKQYHIKIAKSILPNKIMIEMKMKINLQDFKVQIAQMTQIAKEKNQLLCLKIRAKKVYQKINTVGLLIKVF
ncbi:hypothetical protein PPERSA_05977 [Pseudocohnilembus persalinus]|uniref:Uncharacterized protein n=1 Tax=Pseudocohnilembus persalinus TaxID=266149 RepID=A0A0V0R498_PSEPJ|nr:hypothetical protein PPERSA_05977 [Pseudocohnilembus persalinus]|eukprot:KRX09308.1 hypothetical protein PPERSA_05977 [Pseudocohnilembus persalinus]